jgi:antitoxin component of RelBE/YafQ-DinJ toxin-antitoxin module
MRTYRVEVRFTREEHDAAVAVARILGLTMAEHVRFALRDVASRPKVRRALSRERKGKK